MLRVGLTGGIGSGKTTVTNLFAALGIPIIDTDVIAHSLTAPGSPALNAITDALGAELIRPDGSLDRAKLRDEVFRDAHKRARLETILHPLIRQRAEELAASAAGPYCIVVVPLLLEKNWVSMVDRILVVDCSTEQQVRRATQRDRRSEDGVRAIISAQFSRDQRLAAADDVIYNEGDEHALAPQVKKLHRKYLELAAINAS